MSNETTSQLRWQNSNDYSIYTVGLDKTYTKSAYRVNEKFQSHSRKDKYIDKKIDVIQDFEFPTAPNGFTVTPDEQFIIGVGTYPPEIRVWELSNLSLKYSRQIDYEPYDICSLSSDYSKYAVLTSNRSIEFHTRFGRHEKIRLPKYGRRLLTSYLPVEDTGDLSPYLFTLVEGGIVTFDMCKGSFLTDNFLNEKDNNSDNPFNIINFCLHNHDEYNYSEAGILSSSPLLGVCGEGSSFGHVDLRESSRDACRHIRDFGLSDDFTSIAFNGFDVVIGTSSGEVLNIDARKSTEPINEFITLDKAHPVIQVDIKRNLHLSNHHRKSSDHSTSASEDEDEDLFKTNTTMKSTSNNSSFTITALSGSSIDFFNTDKTTSSNEDQNPPIFSIDTNLNSPLKSYKFFSNQNNSLLFSCGECPKFLSHFIPDLGTAPKFAHYLDALTDEMTEEMKIDTVGFGTTHVFVTEDIFHSKITPALKSQSSDVLVNGDDFVPKMHGYFISKKALRKLNIEDEIIEKKKSNLKSAKSIAEDEFLSAIPNRFEITTENIMMDDVEDGVNVDYRNTLDKEKSSILQDDRFSRMFDDADFEIEEEVDDR